MQVDPDHLNDCLINYYQSLKSSLRFNAYLQKPYSPKSTTIQELSNYCQTPFELLHLHPKKTENINTIFSKQIF